MSLEKTRVEVISEQINLYPKITREEIKNRATSIENLLLSDGRHPIDIVNRLALAFVLAKFELELREITDKLEMKETEEWKPYVSEW